MVYYIFDKNNNKKHFTIYKLKLMLKYVYIKLHLYNFGITNRNHIYCTCK